MLVLGKDSFDYNPDLALATLTMDSTVRMQLVLEELHCEEMSHWVDMLLMECFVLSIIARLLQHYGNGAPIEIPIAVQAAEPGRAPGKAMPEPLGLLKAAFDCRAGRLRLWLDGMNTQSTETEGKQTEEKTHE
jgi:hypothetical protein